MKTAKKRKINIQNLSEMKKHLSALTKSTQNRRIRVFSIIGEFNLDSYIYIKMNTPFKKFKKQKVLIDPVHVPHEIIKKISLRFKEN